MAFGTATEGRNGLIYIDTNELAGANAWSLDINQEDVQYSYFGKGWVGTLPGDLGWSGSVGMVHDQDAKVWQSAVTANAAKTILIYPKRSDLTTYYTGSVIPKFGSSADMGSAVSDTGTFTGDGELTLTGFS